MKKADYSPKIITPINKLDELISLCSAGANEFYGGYIPPYWDKKYNSSIYSINGRTFKDAQINSFNDLRQILNYCNQNKITFALTLNAPLYMHEQYPLLFKLMEEYISIGGRHIIAADLGLILYINEKKYPLEVHIGTGGVTLNHYTAEFYQNLGIKRIILSRELYIDEIEKIKKSVPGMDFDVFILIGKCPNIEGLCTFLHDSPERVWHCVEDYEIKGQDDINASLPKNIWAGIKRTDACGLCQVKKLIELKMHGFKIVGRGTGTARKLKAVEGLKKMIEISNNISDEKEFIKEAHNTYKDIFQHKCSQELCYFP